MLKHPHLFFDLDHTLWDFETNAKDTMIQLYETFNLKTKGVHSFDDFFERYIFHNDKLWKRYTQGFMKQEELRWKRMWLALLDFKIADEPLANQLSVAYLRELPNRKKLFDYSFEILEYLKAKGYHLHLITNGFEEVQHRKIFHSGLSPYFTKVITSQGCNSVKPMPGIFDYALNETGAVKEQAIMIGDNLDTDIQGGNNAGWDTVFVNYLSEEKAVSATYTVHHLKDLENIF